MPGDVASRRAELLALGGIVAAGTTAVAVLDPGGTGHFPTCPLLAITGWWCPFCGGLRAVHALAHADVVGAFAQNPVLAVLLPAAVLLWAVTLWRELVGRPWRLHLPKPAWWGIVVLLAVFTVLRNLPGLGLLAPS